MTDLMEWAGKRCAPCEGQVAPLPLDVVQAALATLPGWQTDGRRLSKTFSFRNYYHVMAFVNALAYLAHRENHHPDLEVSFNRVVVHWMTHAIEGVSENDFIGAAKTDLLLLDH